MNSDPLNKLDPLGLYSVNVHYYMTFFLGVAAGVDKDEARVIALATQYIDDNPITQPLPEGWIDPITSVVLDNAAAVDRLEKYHFTQAGYDPERKRYEYHPTPEERATAIRNGYPDPGPVTVHYESDPDYEKRRVKNPSNPQLDRLLGASNKAPTRCAKLQFFGEYLHAFEDTFAHRDQDNEPINVNMGLGHFGYWTNPDYTYDRWGIHPIWPLVHYDTNASRTLEMEKEVFTQMKQWSTGPDMISAGKITEENFYILLDKFNKEKNSNAQIGILQKTINEWFGVNVIKLSGEGANYAYTNTEGQKNRNKYLCGLKQSDFEGTILPNDC